MNSTNRRDFIKKSALGMTALPFINLPYPLFKNDDNDMDSLSVNVFSKHLQFLDYYNAGEAAAEIGFTGLDLTVRNNGHVLPELVKNDLPKAIHEIKKAGSSCSMITTAISSISNPLDVAIVETAAKEGIDFYRTDWYKYTRENTMQEDILLYQQEIKKLSELNKANNIIGCYQNHAGLLIGASFWEIENLLKTANKDFFGMQYDIRHATAEGGYSWQNGFNLLHSQIKTIVLKDFKWMNINGIWQAKDTPIGEGMVDFKSYFKLLKKAGLKPPVSLHLEYDLGGAEKGNKTITVDKKVVFEAMKKDLKAVQKLWKEA
ncbi:sugar phosphate isomerase/epimerase family protein [Flavobacterium algicola]|uniref:sugar phosphate isomerase/epimerase family protein n=1 Tax=Flavobacterium algicola TaxID=556529 RepID=UPI001EFCF00D|nr:TIM barrel protein [Flavobacterium algicola]MCG9793224.1 sugar phosphate isomerase/epimerase [Flavobacterium algicola]